MGKRWQLCVRGIFVRGRYVACVALVFLTSGCGGGIALLSLLGGGSSSGGDALPVARLVQDPAWVDDESPDAIEVLFTVTNDDAGELAARVEFVEVDGQDNELSLRQRATELPSSDDMQQLSTATEARFRWDVPADLGEGKADVRILVTPVEDGREGVTVWSSSLRVGNTPARIERVSLSSRDNVITATFDVIDAEEDPVDVSDIELAVDGGTFVPLSQARFKALPVNQRLDLPSSPTGLPSSFTVQVDEITRGFVGEVCLRIAVRDFEDEKEFVDQDCLPVDFNEAPFVELLPITADDRQSGIVPVRFRVFDADLEGDRTEDVVVRLQVDLNDGQGPRPALEFPGALSDDPRNFRSRALENERGVFHTFLWDAATQLRGRDEALVTLSARAIDREGGPSWSTAFRFRRPALRWVRNLDTGGVLALAGGDYNRDGFRDLVSVADCEGRVLSLTGGFRGLAGPSVVEGAPPGISGIRSADLDGDGFDDAIYGGSSTATGCPGLRLLRGSKGGPTFSGNNEQIKAGTSIALGRFSALPGDLPSVAISAGTDTFIQLFAVRRGVLEEIQPRTDAGNDLGRIAPGDFNQDGYTDLVATARRSSAVYLFLGSASGLEPPITLQDSPQREIDQLSRPVVGFFDQNPDFPDIAVAVGARLQIFSGGQNSWPLWRESHLATKTLYGRGADFNGDGRDDLAAWGHEGALFFFAGTPTGIDAHGKELSVGPCADPTVAGDDYDADGFRDLVVPNSACAFGGVFGRHTVTDLRGGPNGLSRVGSILTGGSPEVAVSEDFDADGLPEVVVANRDSDLAYLRVDTGGLRPLTRVDARTTVGQTLVADLSGNGTGGLLLHESNVLTFHPALVTTDRVELLFEDEIEAVTAGDFDEDGLPEIAVARRVDGTSTVQVFAVNDSRLGPAGPAVEVTGTPTLLLAADFHGGAGADDLVVGTRNHVQLLRSSSTGFQAQPAVSFEERLQEVHPGDFNGDGQLDLALVVAERRGRDGVRFVAGGPDGFAPLALPVPGGERRGTISPTSADYDGDGYVDLVLVNTASENVSWYTGGLEGLRWRQEIPMGERPQDAASGDVDGDGFSDIAVALSETGQVLLLRGSPDGLVEGGLQDTGGTPRALVCADLTGDGFRDVAVVNDTGDGGSLVLLRGTPAGLRPLEETTGFWPLSRRHGRITLGDLTADGVPDLALSNATGVTIFQQRYFSPHTTVLVEPSADTPGPLVDFRTPPRYRLELPPDAFEAATPVSVILTPTFDLPHREARERGRYLTVVAQPVRILRATTELSAPARLTLLLRDKYPFEADDLFPEILEHPEYLRVIRLNEETDTGVPLEIPATDLDIVELDEGTGVRFPIRRFGSYTMVYERNL